jgi:hypothetical protein
VAAELASAMNAPQNNATGTKNYNEPGAGSFPALLRYADSRKNIRTDQE